MTKRERESNRKASLLEASMALRNFAKESNKQELTIKDIDAVLFSIGDESENADLLAKIKLDDVVLPEQDVSKEIAKLIKWMRKNEISDEKIVDCIIYICS